MQDYVIINGKKFKKGYTTGSCAAAASKAAVAMLVSGEKLNSISIDTPAGVRLNLEIVDIQISDESVKCAVVKDGGDDPDMTHGLKIFSQASFMEEPGIKVSAGEGIGRVTLPGLKVAVGKPAINPVPMKMIFKEVGEVIPKGRGVEVLLSVPGGEETALKTYNPKLGIIGGISILGTTGIVNPMSEDAWKESLALELNVMAARGLKKAVYIFGNYGEDFAVDKLGIKPEYLIKVSNFMGFMLDKAVENGFEEILIVGHLGKLVKVAAGIFHTHSRVADARMEILAAYAALEGAEHNILSSIYECKTTEAALSIIRENGLEGTFSRIVANVSKRCSDYTFNKIKIGAILFNSDNELLAADKGAQDILQHIRSNGDAQ
jgi:cobalt-precorrin-5B (C1)-methyltransferase